MDHEVYLIVGLELVNERLPELQLVLDVGAAVPEREQLEEVVGVMEGPDDPRDPGESHVDFLGPLGPVHDVDASDRGVDRCVQGNVESPGLSSD